MTQFACPHCGTYNPLPQDAAYERIECGECHASIRVPSTSPILAARHALLCAFLLCAMGILSFVACIAVSNARHEQDLSTGALFVIAALLCLAMLRLESWRASWERKQR